MKKHEHERGLPLGIPQPELFNITGGSLIEENEQIVAQKPKKKKLSGYLASSQAPGKKEDFLVPTRVEIFLGYPQQGQLRPSFNINGRSGSAWVSPNCCLVEAIAAHLSQSLLKEGGVA